MFAIMKTGERVEIDTACLFDNQYNTVDGRRIFDKDIKRIENDARVNMGRCRYCGRIVKRGEEEKHFSEMESQTCENCNGRKCFWWSDKLIKYERGPETTETTVNEQGETITTRTTTRIEKWEKRCSYERDTRGATCTLKAHRIYGIEWFTPENTFFLKYPGGLETIPAADKLSVRGFTYQYGRMEYYKKIGSYQLSAKLNADKTGIEYFTIRNSRVYYDFRIENGEFYTDRYSFGWRKVKTLEKVPYNVIAAIRKICNSENYTKEAC